MNVNKFAIALCGASKGEGRETDSLVLTDSKKTFTAASSFLNLNCGTDRSAYRSVNTND